MGLLDALRGTAVDGPIVVHDGDDARRELEALKGLRETVGGDAREAIDRQIHLVEAGIDGEERILFELTNSHIPMLILHDLNLTHDGLGAQIDFLVITERHQFVIECKNLFGDIEITSDGDFIRTVRYGRRFSREGIYSPVTQNRRHLDLIHSLRRETRNSLMKPLFDKCFLDNYRSIVVLANPRTVLRARYARKEIRDQVIRADHLVEFIRGVEADPDSVKSSGKQMRELADFFIHANVESPTDHVARFRRLAEEQTVRADDGVAAASNQEPDDGNPDGPGNPDGDGDARRSEDSHGDSHGCGEPEASSADRTTPSLDAVCPRCGAPMVRRRARRGDNAGSEFYGCSRFPHCRAIVAIPWNEGA